MKSFKENALVGVIFDMVKTHFNGILETRRGINDPHGGFPSIKEARYT
jgi:hypothetical protein